MIDDGHAGSPLIRRSGGEWTMPNSTSWTNEAALQELLAAHPGLMPGVDEDAATARELTIPGVGRVDVVAVGLDGSVTVCEVKLARNPEVRRHVVGQLFAYASALAGWGFPELDAKWRSLNNIGLLDAVLGADADPSEREELAADVGRTLAAGAFRLVLAVDELTAELRRTIAYLSSKLSSQVEVVGLEIGYAEHDEVQVIVPRTFGAELASARPRSGGSKTTSFRRPAEEAFADLAILADELAPGFGVVVERIRADLGERIAYMYYGREDSTNPVVVIKDPIDAQPLKFIMGSTPGVRLCLGYTRSLPIEARRRLRDRVAAVPSLAPHLERTLGNDTGLQKRPLLPFAGGLDAPGAAEELTAAIIEALS